MSDASRRLQNEGWWWTSQRAVPSPASVWCTRPRGHTGRTDRNPTGPSFAVISGGCTSERRRRRRIDRDLIIEVTPLSFGLARSSPPGYENRLDSKTSFGAVLGAHGQVLHGPGLAVGRMTLGARRHATSTVGTENRCHCRALPTSANAVDEVLRRPGRSSTVGSGVRTQRRCLPPGPTSAGGR